MSEHLPKWTDALYLIEAKADGNPTMDQMRLMMQSLLADRFKLGVHFESREGPVLAPTLVEPGKLGPKLIPHSDGSPCADTFEMPDPIKLPQLPKPGVEWRQCGTPAGVLGTADGTSLGVRNRPPGLIAHDIYAYGSMRGELDQPVVDHTGLTNVRFHGAASGRDDFSVSEATQSG
jgi:bla regulator protein blaR1